MLLRVVNWLGGLWASIKFHWQFNDWTCELESRRAEKCREFVDWMESAGHAHPIDTYRVLSTLPSSVIDILDDDLGRCAMGVYVSLRMEPPEWFVNTARH